MFIAVSKASTCVLAKKTSALLKVMLLAIGTAAKAMMKMI